MPRSGAFISRSTTGEGFLVRATAATVCRRLSLRPQENTRTITDAYLYPDETDCARKQPLTRPAAADDNAVAGHPLPKGAGYVRWGPRAC
ncbi:hypothetical protein SBA2_320024 [Acidobacteriia bacterium SbA2]|nr:hypothetical protein SBA2_320024 [Acidobacteriia bacterium SbA2]